MWLTCSVHSRIRDRRHLTEKENPRVAARVEIFGSRSQPLPIAFRPICQRFRGSQPPLVGMETPMTLRQSSAVLHRPACPRYPALRSSLRRSDLIEQWIDAAMFTRSWAERGRAFDRLILEVFATGQTPQNIVKACSALLSVACEHLADREVRCIDAAWSYALCDHSEWQAAGRYLLVRQFVVSASRWDAEHPAFLRLRKTKATA